MNTTVSIIVPAFNAEDTLRRCIASIVAQDYAFTEIIIVDDGSTDASLSVAREFKKEHRNIKVISQANHGVSAARNAGLNIAQGNFIQFVDADDYIEPNATTTLVALMQDKVDLAIAGYVPSPTNPAELPREYLVPIPLEGRVSKSDLLKRHLPYFIRDGHNVNKMYRARLLREQAIAFPEGLTILEDLVFNLNYLAHIRTAAFTKTPIYNIENQPNSAVRSFHPAGSRTVDLIFPAIARLLNGISLRVEEASDIAELKYRFVTRAIQQLTHPKNSAKISTQISEITKLIQRPDVQEVARTVQLPRPRSRILNSQIRYKNSVVIWAIFRGLNLMKRRY